MMPPPDKEEETGFQSYWGRLLGEGGPEAGHRHLTGLQRGLDGSKPAPQESLGLNGDEGCLEVTLKAGNVWVGGTSKYPSPRRSSLGGTRCSGRGSSNGLFSLKKQS